MSNSAALTLPLDTAPVYNVNLHIVPPENQVDLSSKTAEDRTLKDKIIQISSVALIFFGALFLLASAGLFASSLFIGTTATMLGEAMYPLGVLSLIAGINLFQDGKMNSVKISQRLGPVTVSI